MRSRRIAKVVMLVGLTGWMFQCKDASEVTPDEENELITTVQLTFTEAGTSTSQTFTYRDVDGEGGNPPSAFETIRLKPATAYTLAVSVQDESKSPAEDITEEIEEKADEHLFVFSASPSSLLTYTYGDKDARNLPIGLTGTATTGSAGTGKLKVQLRHQPPVSGTAVKDGTPGPGSDDVNLDFELLVQ